MTARPFIDAALLGAHGHRAAPIRFRKGPAMSSAIRYALLPSLNAGAQIRAFPDLNALARAIHRARGAAPLDLNEVEDMEIADSAEATRGVEIWTMNEGNDAVECWVECRRGCAQTEEIEDAYGDYETSAHNWNHRRLKSEQKRGAA